MNGMHKIRRMLLKTRVTAVNIKTMDMIALGVPDEKLCDGCKKMKNS
jgi:hypothetical protein